jgi:hypothetical protein
MSGVRNWNLEFLNHNANRDYPLTVEASATSVDGDFRLPRDFLVAMYFSLNAAHNVDPARFTLKTIIVSSAGVTLVIGYQTENAVLTVATAMIPRDSHVQHQAYRLGGIGNYADLDGWVVIGRFDNMDLQPVGEWSFDIDGGRLELDVVRPQIRGVTRLRAQNGSDLSDPVTGDIILRAGRNMRITPVVISGQDPAFVFDAIDGEGLNEECICEGDVEKGPAIRSINKIPPTSDGDFTLLGNQCVDFVPIENGLQIKDKCSEPCCGCSELEAVTAALEQFGRQATTLENFLVNLEARVTQMDQSVLGSRLGDRGCVQCEES